ELEATLSAGPQHTATSGTDTGAFTQDLVELDARLELRRRVFRSLRVSAGFDFQSRYQWLATDGPPPPTPDVVQVPASLPSRAQPSRGCLASPALYAKADWQLLRRLAVTAGVRADWFGGTDGTYVQPRLMARLAVARATFVKLGAGLFYQPQLAAFRDPLLGN